uniref:Uncharacterized protein n=1 Tax=Lepeophtheirus salmonis TaxID=72036 RepID=A0A0K2T127_LEPSM
MVLGVTKKSLARRFINLVGSSIIFFSKLNKNFVSLLKFCLPLPNSLERSYI